MASAVECDDHAWQPSPVAHRGKMPLPEHRRWSWNRIGVDCQTTLHYNLNISATSQWSITREGINSFTRQRFDSIKGGPFETPTDTGTDPKLYLYPDAQPAG